jgi:hypothetical protein
MIQGLDGDSVNRPRPQGKAESADSCDYELLFATMGRLIARTDETNPAAIIATRNQS